MTSRSGRSYDISVEWELYSNQLCYMTSRSGRSYDTLTKRKKVLLPTWLHDLPIREELRRAELYITFLICFPSYMTSRSGRSYDLTTFPLQLLKEFVTWPPDQGGVTTYFSIIRRKTNLFQLHDLPIREELRHTPEEPFYLISSWVTWPPDQGGVTTFCLSISLSKLTMLHDLPIREELRRMKEL